MAAVWHGTPNGAQEPAIRAAFSLARANDVAALFVGQHPTYFAREIEQFDRTTDVFRRNLREASARIAARGIRPILIKADVDRPTSYTNFDLVVGTDGWGLALAALRTWGARTSGHVLEPDKVLVHPPSGPAAHLHQSVAWFGVPVISTEFLRQRARAGEDPWLLPAPADALRIYAAHAFFQNLSLDLSELLAIRDLLDEVDLDETRHEARAEGWHDGFELVMRCAIDAIAQLDARRPIALPVALPSTPSLRLAAEHVRHLWRRRHAREAIRESLLRGPLTVAKWRRVRLLRRPSP